MLGAAAREGLLLLHPSVWPLILVNVAGCWLMGRFRPGVFWGTGVLGGFTSFSAFHLMLADAPGYFVGTALTCTAAWFLGDRTCSRR